MQIPSLPTNTIRWTTTNGCSTKHDALSTYGTTCYAAYGTTHGSTYGTANVSARCTTYDPTGFLWWLWRI